MVPIWCTWECVNNIAVRVCQSISSSRTDKNYRHSENDTPKQYEQLSSLLAKCTITYLPCSRERMGDLNQLPLSWFGTGIRISVTAENSGTTRMWSCIVLQSLLYNWCVLLLSNTESKFVFLIQKEALLCVLQHYGSPCLFLRTDQHWSRCSKTHATNQRADVLRYVLPSWIGGICDS